MSKSKKEGDSQFYKLILAMRKFIRIQNVTFEELPTEIFYNKIKDGYDSGVRKYSKEHLRPIVTMEREPTFEECCLAKRILNVVLNSRKKSNNNEVPYRNYNKEQVLNELKNEGYRILKPVVITKYEEI